MSSVEQSAQRLVENIEKVLFGKRELIELAVVGLLAEGHLLLEDVPGVGKTILARAVARSIGSSFARVQCTPDLLPTDLTGVNIFNQKTEDFEFRPGPLHNQIILADEINRATPKTQSALLECMEEGQITVDGTTHKLPRPFLVIATQNPVEYEGTFPLPEAQVDRFLLRSSLGYPNREAELQMLVSQHRRHPVETLEQVLSAEALVELQGQVREIRVEAPVREYIVDLVRLSREAAGVTLGASPRGSLALYRAGQALAALRGRDYVTPDDVQFLAVPTLSHRLICGGDALGRAGTPQVKSLLEKVPVPV